MASKLMNLRNVPGDELDDIYVLLDTHAIDFYETRVGAFGISAPALWLKDDSQLPQARQLLNDYARERALSARQRWQTELEAGNRRTWVEMLREQPLRVVLYMALIAALVYFSLVPFWQMKG